MFLSKYKALWTRNPELAFHGVKQRQPGFRTIGYKPDEKWRFRINFFQLRTIGITYGDTSGWSVKSEGDSYVRLILHTKNTTRFLVGRTERFASDNLTFIPPESSFSETDKATTILLRLEKRHVARAFSALDQTADINSRIHSQWLLPSNELHAFGKLVRLFLHQIGEEDTIVDEHAFQVAYEELFYLYAAQALCVSTRHTTGSISSLKKMVEYIKSNATRPISIQEIASAGGVSIRVAQIMFRNELGTTMTLALRSIRLAKAHDLIINGLVNSITDAALGSGFHNLSEFSRIYRETYGELPSKSLRDNRK